MKLYLLEYINRGKVNINDPSFMLTNLFPGAYHSLHDAIHFVIDESVLTDRIIISSVSSDDLVEVKPVARMASYRGV